MMFSSGSVYSSLGNADISKMICHLISIFVWISLVPQLAECGGVTWYEPSQARTTRNPNEILPPTIVRVYEGYSVTLDWNYNLTSGLFGAVLKLNGAGIVNIQSNGKAGTVNENFKGRFNIISTPGRVSLIISQVTAADDKANGEFSCELVDSNADTWKRAIQVQVLAGDSVTWYEPTPVRITLSPREVLPPGILRVYEGSSATLNWNYSLTSRLRLGVLKFNGAGIVVIQSNGQAGVVNDNFKERYNIRSTPGRVSLFIAKVTAADDKASGEFSCELIDTSAKTWKRAIQVQILKVSGSVTWNELTPVRTTKNPSEVLPPAIVQVSEGSSVTLSWNYRVTSGVFGAVLQFSGAGIVNIQSNGQAGAVNDNFKGRFNISSTPGRISLIISQVTTADDKANGEFSCELIDSNAETWKRAIQVQVQASVKIINTPKEYIVTKGESVILNCEAKGNPPPSYSWTPCDQKRYCNESTLVISRVLHDANYTCKAANEYDKDFKSVSVFIGGNVINVTFADGGYDQSPLLERLDEMMRKAFTSTPSYKSMQFIAFRCGNASVDLALKFNTPTKERDVIAMLGIAVMDGILGNFIVLPSTGTVVCPSTPRSSSDASTNLPLTIEAESRTGTCLSTTGITVGALFGSVLFCAVIALILAWFVRKRRKCSKATNKGTATVQRTYEPVTEEEGDNASTALEMIDHSPSQYAELNEMTRSEDTSQTLLINTPHCAELKSEYASLSPSTRCWEIASYKVTLKEVVRKGAFGQVAKATVTGLHESPNKTLVAVKMLKDHASESDKKQLQSELELMKQLKPHPYVVKLLGCVTKSGPLLVLIEYVPYGDLLGYLRKSRGLNDTYFKDPDIKPQKNLTSQQLTRFAWQIADGMSYLSSIPVVHRDLAARNVLVGEGETCKVTDFGMARDVQEDNIYERKSGGRLPVKWTAIEALLYGRYSTKSDVWSYGVLLYEIFTIGGSPYPRMDGRKIAHFLQEGYRMPKPQHVDDKLYDIMTNCWKDDPNARPSFEHLRNELKKMERQKGLINFKNYEHHQYANVDDLAV